MSTRGHQPKSRLKPDQVGRALEAYRQGRPEEFDRLLGDSQRGICSLLRRVLEHCRIMPPAGPPRDSSGRNSQP